MCLLARLALLAPLPGRAEHPFEETGAGPGVAADHHRRPDVRVPRRPHHLEDGPEPGAGAPVRRPASDLLVLEQDAAAVSPEKPTNAVKKSRLAGPVRPDQASERAGLDGEANLLHGLDGAERLRDRVDHEGRRVRHGPTIRRGYRVPPSMLSTVPCPAPSTVGARGTLC